MGAVAAEQAVEQLLALGDALGEEVGREEPLGEVVEAAVARRAGRSRGCPASASASRTARDLVRRAPVPVDRLAAVEVGGRDRPVAPDPLEELLDVVAVLVERRSASWARAGPVPGEPVPGQLAGRQDAQALVVGLEQEAPLVEQAIGPGAPVAGDAGVEDEVVVAPGDLERVELERAEAVDDREDALLGRPAASAAGRGGGGGRGSAARRRADRAGAERGHRAGDRSRSPAGRVAGPRAAAGDAGRASRSANPNSSLIAISFRLTERLAWSE